MTAKRWIDACHFGDCRLLMARMAADGVRAHTVVTSPPYYGLRSYLPEDAPNRQHELGLERTPREYVNRMVDVFRHVRSLLVEDGTVWLSVGDSYAASRSWQAHSTLGGRKHGPAQGVAGRSSAVPPGLKAKDLIGIPWMLAFALRDDGWYLRSAIVWAKPNGMPGSQLDRPTSSYEYVFLLSRRARYYSDFDAIRTPPRESTLVRLAQDVQAQAGSHRANGGTRAARPMRAAAGSRGGHHWTTRDGRREIATGKQRGHSRRHAGFNERWDADPGAAAQPVMMRDVWFVAPGGYRGAHFAVMPPEIARRCVLAGSRPGDIVFDPFMGSGTTAAVAAGLGRRFVGCELNPAYASLQRERLARAGSGGGTP
ncbi:MULTISPECIES: DNA-methyltransferase [Burkholderia]|uniref:Methyltransferase n=1 Tax=Burkholderia pseudomultivorans TaxID=1207504 RepID=A0ABU2E9Y2_9BURK|nr:MULTISPECIES: site-specific DNA-methyltransferase [Burkholderia]MBR8428406.1 site-specific DNA-methyltransferase [Burkholderia cenocepacia]MDN7669368.1 site-specific DNA-methyltransferase [Burkholderia vietnamiensis]MDR8730534.1 Modification methylase DpnIIB [Burkholderia pseudomultivorans]MDR8738451.1 Modification methylase DpnIIB [Burkholderia pseudomultivorans]MDR8744864.1 Modification methylase DpnIIB [Burkholderia pseudomultivorans]